MQNIVINLCEKFHYDRLRNDRALGNGKSDNNKDKNNVRSHCKGEWGPVSGSNKLQRDTISNSFICKYKLQHCE